MWRKIANLESYVFVIEKRLNNLKRDFSNMSSPPINNNGGNSTSELFSCDTNDGKCDTGKCDTGKCNADKCDEKGICSINSFVIFMFLLIYIGKSIYFVYGYLCINTIF